MPDLIDRKKLLEVLDEYLRVSFLPTTEYLKGCHAGFETAIDFVEAAPAIDVEPVRHGRWENHPDIGGYLRCDKCRNAVIAEDWLVSDKWSYCPNCGAKMEAEDD